MIRGLMTLFALVLTQADAFAASQRVTVNIPQSALAANPIAASSALMRIELQASSWTPASIGFGSRVASASEFSAVLPQLSLSHWLTIASPEWATISLRSGVDYLSLTRKARVSYGTVTREENQALHWLALRAGIEAEPEFLSAGPLRSQLGFGLIPAFAVIQSSALSNSQDGFSLGYEVGAGLALEVLRATEITVGASYRFGSSDSADFRGSNFRAGLRFAL